MSDAEEDYGWGDYELFYITCKYCHEEGLHWEELSNGKYRLFDDEDGPHICSKAKERA